MLINKKQLKQVLVKTQSGVYLGRVIDFELETDTGKIKNYIVKAKGGLVALLAKTLIVNNKQIISFDHNQMIVLDNLIKEETNEEALPAVENIESTEPAITSKEV